MTTPMGLMPHITVHDAAAAIDFYTRAFGACEISRNYLADSTRIMHAALEIMGCRLLLNDDFPEFAGGRSRTPEAVGGCPVVLHLQVTGVDAVWNQALAAGATVSFPLKDQFWGDRYGQLLDPFGYTWSLGETVAAPRPLDYQVEVDASKSHPAPQTKEPSHQ